MIEVGVIGVGVVEIVFVEIRFIEFFHFFAAGQLTVNFAVFDFDDVAGCADDAFNEVGVFFSIEWGFEYDDVVMFWVADKVKCFVDNYFFAEVVLALSFDNIESAAH